MHWAAHGKTAAEIVSERAKAELPYMGLWMVAERSRSKEEPARPPRKEEPARPPPATIPIENTVSQPGTCGELVEP